jgi:hypothetical protein
MTKKTALYDAAEEPMSSKAMGRSYPLRLKRTILHTSRIRSG